jgi:hypothetical protein
VAAPEEMGADSPTEAWVYGHVNPYGVFELDMSTRLPIETRVAA